MLSKEQQDIIENSIWVVNTALKQQGLQANEDLRQSAILYMCKCLERFDPTKNIKWSTYAYKNVFLYIKRTHYKETKKQSFLVSDDVIFPQLADECQTTLDESSYLLEEILKRCTKREQQIVKLKLQGYKVFEISEIVGCSQSKVNTYMQSIKDKFKEIEDVSC